MPAFGSATLCSELFELNQQGLRLMEMETAPSYAEAAKVFSRGIAKAKTFQKELISSKKDGGAGKNNEEPKNHTKSTLPKLGVSPRFLQQDDRLDMDPFFLAYSKAFHFQVEANEGQEYDGEDTTLALLSAVFLYNHALCLHLEGMMMRSKTTNKAVLFRKSLHVYGIGASLLRMIWQGQHDHSVGGETVLLYAALQNNMAHICGTLLLTTQQEFQQCLQGLEAAMRFPMPHFFGRHLWSADMEFFEVNLVVAGAAPRGAAMA